VTGKHLLALGIVGAVSGAIVGLIPFLVGLYRRRPKSAIVCFLACIVSGALTGAEVTFMTALVLTGYIWGGKPIRWASDETPEESQSMKTKV
jgi:uncharacterized YccA/Bax inhibitor family protein